MNKQVAEQTIYFPKFAEQSFFHKKHSPPAQESNGRPLTYVYSHYSIREKGELFWELVKDML